MGTDEFNAGGNPAMDWHPIQGGVEILLVASCWETGISSGLMGHLARKQTLPLPFSKTVVESQMEQQFGISTLPPEEVLFFCSKRNDGNFLTI